MPSITHLVQQYQLLTNWYIAALDGIDDRDGSKTISDNANSLEWLAGHLIVGRYRNMLRLGIQIEPYQHIDKFMDQTVPPPNAIAFDKAIQYSGLSECTKQWKEYSSIFLDKLQTVDENILQTEIPFRVPTGSNTVEGALIFMALHESYHIGQMSMIRKSIGYPAMKLLPKK